MQSSGGVARRQDNDSNDNPTEPTNGRSPKHAARALLLKRRTTEPGGANVGTMTGGEMKRLALDTARRIGKRADPEVLRRDYRRLLHLTQELAYDRAIERLFFVPTRGRVPLDRLSIDSPHRRFGHSYHPVHRISFDLAMAQLPERLEEFTFIDYGAGRGRALLLAATYPFRRVIGLEFAAELHDDAQMNIAQFPRSLMKCRNVECQLTDAVDVAIPDDKCVLFFNDPFDDEVLKSVLARITASYRAHPRRMYLAFVRPPTAASLDRLMELAVVFEPVAPSPAQQAGLQLLCPDDVQVYKTLI